MLVLYTYIAIYCKVVNCLNSYYSLALGWLLLKSSILGLFPLQFSKEFVILPEKVRLQNKALKRSSRFFKCF